MRGLRQILLSRHRLALWLVALALATKALLPGGYMIEAHSQVLTIAICADSTGAHLTRQIVVPREETGQDQSSQHAKSAACPFSALAMAGNLGADPILLGLALAFVLAIGFAARPIPERATRTRLRPPLRAPPVIA